MTTNDTNIVATTVPSADEAFGIEIKDIKIHAPPGQPFRPRCCGRRKHYISVSIGDEANETKAIPTKGDTVQWDDTLVFSTFNDSSRVQFDVKVKRWGRSPTILGTFEDSVAALLEASHDTKHSVARDLKPQSPSYQVTFGIIRTRKTLALQTQTVLNKAADGVKSMGTAHSMPSTIPSTVTSGLSDAVQDLTPPMRTVLARLEFLCELGDTLAEIHPWAKAAWGILSGVYKIYHQKLDNDDSIQDLMSIAEKALEFAKTAEEVPEQSEQQKAISIKILKQVMECGYFIQEYTRRGFWNHVGHVFLKLEPLVSDHKTRLNELANEYWCHATLQIQTYAVWTFNEIEFLRDKINKIDKKVDKIGIQDIPYAAGASFQTSKTCLPGTRVALLDDISDWLNNNTDQQILLLTGGAGTGKSTVAHTIAQRYKELHRLGSSFHFSKGEAYSSPHMLFCTIARDLADHNEQFRTLMAGLDTATRTSKGIEDQFTIFS